jgi:parallel beta-helix repeat protein
LDQPQTTNFWHVHDNVIYNAAEVPLQLNGDFNLIERNDIFHGEIYGDNGSQGPPIILLGHHNIVRNNFLHDSGQSFGGYGGTDYSWGLLLENDMADYNLIEGNVIFNTQEGITVWGGDNNLIRNNIVFTEDWYDMTYEYAFGLLTAQKGCDRTPSQHPYCPTGDQYNNCQYINYGTDDCFPEDNQFYHNTIYGFQIGMACGCEFGCSDSCSNTRFKNNALGSFQHVQQNYGSAVLENNLTMNGVVSVPDRDFRLLLNSSLIDAGVELGTCDVPDLANSTHDSAAVRTVPCAGSNHIGLTQACIEAIRNRPDDHRIGVDDLSTCFVSEPRKRGSAVDVGAYERTDEGWVIKTADRNTLPAGERLAYVIRVTNITTGMLTATVADVLPDHITAGETATGSLILPGDVISWTVAIPTPGDVWTTTIAVTVEIGYTGLLTNVVRATADGDAVMVYTSTVLIADAWCYLPLILKH